MLKDVFVLFIYTTVGTVYVSFAGPQNTAGGPFETLEYII